jgi:hypothetical protein
MSLIWAMDRSGALGRAGELQQSSPLDSLFPEISHSIPTGISTDLTRIHQLSHGLDLAAVSQASSRLVLAPRLDLNSIRKDQEHYSLQTMATVEFCASDLSAELLRPTPTALRGRAIWPFRFLNHRRSFSAYPHF